jgi:hypothetical protein
MGDQITGQVKCETERNRERARTHDRTPGGSGRDVK